MRDDERKPADDTSGGRSHRMHLTAATFSGMRWSYVDAAAAGVMQIVYISTMARLLAPAVFGLMAIALLTVNFGQYLSQMGVSQAIIQRPAITNADKRAAFSASVGLGIVFYVLLWLIAPAVADFFTEPDAVAVLRVMGAQFIFISLGTTSQGLLRRDLRFGALAASTVASVFVGYVIGIAMAMAGAGVWSLVSAVLSINLLTAVLQYALVRHDIRPIFSVRRFGSLYGYGVRVSGVTLMQFLSKQLDTFAVGRYASTAALGQYNRAFTIVSAPLSRHLTVALSRVLLPAYSRIQDDRARLRRAYLSLTTIGGAIMLSLAAGMAVAAPELVRVLLGDQWDRATDFVPYFAFALSLRTLTNFADILAQARAELDRLLVLQVSYLVLLGASYVAVSGLGNTLWFAVVLFAGEFVFHGAFARLMGRVVGVRAAEVLRAYLPALVCAAGVAASVALARTLGITLEAPALATLIAEMLAGAVGLVVMIRINPFSIIRRELHDRLDAAGVLASPVAATVAGILLGATGGRRRE